MGTSYFVSRGMVEPEGYGYGVFECLTSKKTKK
jgi:hypothetical protein